YKYGIINGVSDSEFNPEGMITRQEATTMVARAAKLCGMEISKSDDEIRNILAGFTDYLESDDWAKAGLAFCYGEKILDDSEMEIKPNTEILRSEVAQMVFNMLDKTKLINK
ncbi:MAG: S-layer homology domain-containing protein, partial [Oscillospiraceae bacterium]